MASRAPWLLTLVMLGACGDDGGPAASGSTSTTGSSTGASSDSGDPPASSTGLADGTTTDGSTSAGSSTGLADSTTDADSSTGAGSSSDGPRPLPPNGCADGEREGLEDERQFPDIAACSGGWQVPGVLVNATYCRRQGGDDGPNPVGRGCSVEDLCGDGWHVCDGLGEVSAAGVRHCDDVFWNGAFYVTRQSSEGANTCTPTGLNDVFGCGDIGYPMIIDCAPLNRSTANLCVSLPEPWSCDESADEEALFIVKSAPQFGGALCCRD